jgi:hypothetical protein
VAAGIARWVRGEEYGVETLVSDDESREDLEHYGERQMSTDRPTRETMSLEEATISNM